MSWLLDADVLSQPAKRRGDPRVTAWLETEQDNCYTSAVVLAQLAYWVRSKEGRQRQALQAWLTRLMAALHGRILSFNASVAHVWAEQQRELERAGRRMPIEDSYIAATARRYNLTIVTGNDKTLSPTWREGLQSVQRAATVALNPASSSQPSLGFSFHFLDHLKLFRIFAFRILSWSILLPPEPSPAKSTEPATTKPPPTKPISNSSSV